jgi:hypothetical protein
LAALDGLNSTFTRANAHGVFHGKDKNLPVTDATGASGRQNRIGHYPGFDILD